MPPQKVRYPPSNTTAQWFASGLPGKTFSQIDKIVLHTTEGAWWPAYQGGHSAPNLTARPDTVTRTLDWRAHFPIGMSARALMNQSGGVETNNANVVQVELIGTCVTGGPGMNWTSAPDWALQGVADFLRWMQANWNVPLEAPPMWLSYPASYGNTVARMSKAEWLSFRGTCGHQHVPENDHGDPGSLPIARIMKMAGKVQEEEQDVDADTINKIAIAAAKEVWNRFLVPEAEGEMHPLREALGETLDNTQNLLTLVNAQQAQIDTLRELVTDMVGKRV